jgi:CDP-diacylglycerol--glycerol-3-phosphate 3-phosphatidyltransferase
MSAPVSDASTNQVWNVPNQITIARIGLAIVSFILLPMGYYIPALVVFLIAATTDWADGYWARKYNQVTQLGRMLDPFADKFIICGIFVFLAAEEGSEVYAWMAVVIMSRELLVTALRSFLEQQGADFSANMAGKLKMVFQCITAAGAILLLHFHHTTGSPDWLVWTVRISAWVSVASTVQSGIGYIFAAVRLMSAPK